MGTDVGISFVKELDMWGVMRFVLVFSRVSGLAYAQEMSASRGGVKWEEGQIPEMAREDS